MKVFPTPASEVYRYESPVEGNYECKHNLLARFESIRLEPHRALRVKSLTLYVLRIFSSCLSIKHVDHCQIICGSQEDYFCPMGLYSTFSLKRRPRH